MDQRNVVTASDVINKVRQNTSEFKDLHINGEVDISGSINVMSLTFINCKFEGQFRIRFARLSEGIHFIDCDFTQRVILGNLQVDANSTAGHIEFNGCKKLALEINDVNAGTLNIDACEAVMVIIGYSTFRTFKLEYGSLEFIRLENLKCSELQLLSPSITREISIQVSSINTMYLVQIKGEPRIEITNLDCKTFEIYECVLSHLQFVNVSEKLTITRNEFTKESNIEGVSDINHKNHHCSLEFRGNTFRKAFKVDGEYLTLENVTVDCNDSLSGKLHFDKGYFDHLKITGTNTDGDLLFTHSEVHTLEFSDFTNMKSLSLSGCEIRGSDANLIISRSDMGKTKFLNHNFDKYGCVSIEYSFLSEILVISSRWFNDGRLDVGASENEHARREVYRQLKHASEKQGDRIQALLFQAEELKAFEEEITITKRWWSADRWILRFSKTNGFGLHWDRALGWLFVWTIPFFIAMAIIASPCLSLSPARNMHELFWSAKIIIWDRLPILMQLFNPAHNPLAYVHKDVSPLYFVLDGVHRIGAAFLIVQIVTAFRKYVRS